jgi:hypothetical protein
VEDYYPGGKRRQVGLHEMPAQPQKLERFIDVGFRYSLC